jgi:hypothetical protein
MNEAQEEDLGQRILAVVAKTRRGLTIDELASKVELTFQDAKAAIERLVGQNRLVRYEGLTPDDRSVTFDLPSK